jgi:glycosyltransferase involved in cell wall biosynthesis
MALGRPVVCNDHPEQSQVIRESGAGLCVPWNASAFADALIQLLDHPESAEAMGSRGPSWVAAHRTYPEIAKDVAAVCHRLLKAEGT